jgi:hypothetical protein
VLGKSLHSCGWYGLSLRELEEGSSNGDVIVSVVRSGGEDDQWRAGSCRQQQRKASIFATLRLINELFNDQF